MTFDELPLYEAIHDVRNQENPGIDMYRIEDQQKLVSLILARLVPPVPWGSSEIVNAWVAYRKLPNGKGPLTINVARAHGRKCFYANRGVGNCNNQVSIDRLIPGSREGEYTIENCVIACGFHNSQRNDQTIEEYLRAKQ